MEKIIAIITLITTLLILLTLAIICVLIDIKTTDLKKKHILTLNEHDKAVIATYQAIHYELFKKRGNKK